MVALLPVVLEPRVRSAAWIGALMAAEGLFAILVPYAVGAFSDRLPRGLVERCGRRTCILVLAAPVMAACLGLVPFRDRLWAIAALLFLFFAALHAFMTPLLALVAEAVSRERWGRAYGVFGAMRAGGIAYGLVAGGLLFSLWPPLPFLVAAGLVLATTAVTYAARHEEDATAQPGRAAAAQRCGDADSGEERTFWREIVRRPGIRWFLLGNAFATAAIDGVRPYVFLYATAVLGLTVARSSLLLAFLLAGVAAGSVLVGWLGDRIGRSRLLIYGALSTGLVLGLGVFVRGPASAILLAIPAGLGAATLATLPFPVFAAFTHGPALGRYSGVFRVSIGLARLVAPLVVGVAIDRGATLFPESAGYPFMWPAAATFALLAAASFWRAERGRQGRRSRPGRGWGGSRP